MKTPDTKDEGKCPVEFALDVIGGKWKGMVLYYLCDGPCRFNELRRKLPGVSQKVLTTQLRELESNGIICREVYPEVPPRVEYYLSELGKKLQPTIRHLESWGTELISHQNL